MAQNIKLFAGRLKKLQFTWREGPSPDSPALDLSAAAVAVHSTSLSPGVSAAILNASQGLCELTFEPSSTETKRGIQWVMIALTYTSNPGYSPDPVRIEVAVNP